MLEKEFLQYLLGSTANLGKIASSGFKSSFLDHDTSEFSPIRHLFDIIHTFYLKYRKALDGEHLTEYLNLHPYKEDEKKLILLTFEQVKVATPSKTFEFMLDMLKNQHAKYLLQSKLDKGIDQLVQNNTEAALRTIKDAVFRAENVLQERAVEGPMQESIWERAKNYSDVKRGIVKAGLATSFPTFDRLSGGMKPGELVIVMAGPREGKSTFLLNVAHHNQMKLHKNVFFVSAENPKKQFERRYDSLHSGLSYTKLRDGKLDPNEEAIFKKTLQDEVNAKGTLFVWDQPVCTPQMVAAKLVELETKYKFDIIIVDYLSLLRADNPSSSNWLDVGNIAVGLREIARTLDIPVLAAAQVGRKGAESKKDKYESSDIALSYMVIFHADTVLALKVSNPDILNSGLGVCELNASIVKCRDGSQGEFIIDANFDRMKLQERTQYII